MTTARTGTKHQLPTRYAQLLLGSVSKAVLRRTANPVLLRHI
jgi:nucleotide-binding universal stress UspA family protein